MHLDTESIGRLHFHFLFRESMQQDTVTCKFPDELAVI